MNVVFDLGGVLIRWRPDEIVARVFEDPGEHARARKAMFEHPDWLEFDRGTLEPDEVVVRAAARAGMPGPRFRALLEQVPLAMTPEIDVVDLVRYTREKGNKLYVLSNMPHSSIEYLERTYAIWDLFEGTVISCRIGLLKPEPGIYRYLLDSYALDPAESVFIDDVQRNVDGALAAGMQGIRFESPGQCESELRTLGCL